MADQNEKEMANNSAATSFDREAGGEVSKKRKFPGILSRDYFMAEVTPDHADLLMLACCLVSGFLDSVVYSGMFWIPSKRTSHNSRDRGLTDIRLSMGYIRVYANW